jgi:hypothetical protein
MFLASTTSAKAETIEGRCDEIQGWTSSRYGHRSASPTLQFTMEGAAPAIAISVVLPIHADEHADENNKPVPDGAWPFDLRRLQVARGTAIACAKQGQSHHDLWIAASAGEPVEVLDYKMHGEFFWVRSHASGERELFAINASYFTCSERPLLQESAALESVQLHWNADDTAEPWRGGEERPCVESAA